MSIERLSRPNSVLVHQDVANEDDGNPACEMPIVLVPYAGIISLSQNCNPDINIDVRSVPELCKALKAMAKSEEVET